MPRITIKNSLFVDIQCHTALSFVIAGLGIAVVSE